MNGDEESISVAEEIGAAVVIVMVILAALFC